MSTRPTSFEFTSERPGDVRLFRLLTPPAISARERKVDEVLADSFPASDPPPWTLGRPPAPPLERTARAIEHDAVWSSHATVILAGGKRTAWDWLATALGAIGIGMAVPIAILLIGIPIAVAIRTLIEAAAWLAAILGN